MSDKVAPLKINWVGYLQWRDEDPRYAKLCLMGRVGALAEPMLILTEDPEDTYENLKLELSRRGLRDE